MRKLFFTTLFLVLGLGHVWGDSFTSDGTTRLYFENIEVPGWSSTRWVVDGGTAWIQVANSSSIADDGGTFSGACVHVDGYKYYIVVPEGTWSHFRLGRGNDVGGSSWSNRTGAIAFDGNEHNFLTSYASEEGWTDATWSSVETVTIYTIPDSLHTYKYDESTSYTWGTDGSDLKANIQLGDTYWNKISMENTGRTYNGKAIYSCSFIALYGGVKQIQFQLYNGETYKGEYKYIPDGSWAANNVFADKTYVGYRNDTHTWINFITYELDGGTKFFADPTHYTVESADITLHAAARSGYVFAGWYSDEDRTIAANTIASGSTGDKTFYAKWTTQSCLGEHGAGTVFNMLMNVGPSAAVNLTAGNYVDLSSHATFTRGTGVYGTTSSNAQIVEAANDNTRRRLQMTSTSHVVTLNLSCPLVAYDTIIIYDTHGTTTNKTYEFSITSSPTYSNANSTSGATVSKSTDTTRYVVPVGSGLIGATPIYIWGSASTDLRIRRIEIRRTNTYKLTYNANGGTGAPAEEYRPASAVALSSTVPTFGNYTFAGWNTKNDGSGDNYASGADYTIPSATTTLYAKWTLDVTLNDNGGTGGSTSVTMTHKSNTHSAITLPTRDGYTLSGYYDRSDGGIQITDATGALLKGVSNSYLSSDGTWKYSTSGLTLYAHWAQILTFTGGTEDHETEWNTASNWSPASVPTIYNKVIIEAPVTVNIANAKARSIIIYNDGDTKTGKLTIEANKGLEVAETISLTTNGSNSLATRATDLILESSADGNATLIFDNSNEDKATVYLYSKGWTDGTQGGGTWNWQMIGSPMTDATRINDYYGGYMYEWNSGWEDMTNTEKTLTPFAGYSATYPTTSAALHTYEIDGTLVPTGDKSIDIPANTSIMAVANSWTAPIYVKNITFTNCEPANIYIFNTGYAGGGTPATKSADRWAAGTYHAVPINSSPYTGDSLIASMQGFYVRNKLSSAGSMAINYDAVVRPTGDRNSNAGPMHAPKRQMDEVGEPSVLKLFVSDAEHDDRVILLEREDFSRGFDNGWDGEKFQVNAVKTTPRLFAINESGGKEEISAIPQIEGTVIGFRPGSETNYTMSFEYGGAETLYLYDTNTGITTLIDNDNKYAFTSNGTNEDARFEIRKSPAILTGVVQVSEPQQTEVRKVLRDGMLYIERAGKMYTIEGSLIK